MTEQGRHPQAPFGVLVFPGGTEIGLEVRQSLMDLKEVRLAGAGSPSDRPGPFAYRRWAVVDDVDEPGWIAGLDQASASSPAFLQAAQKCGHGQPGRAGPG